MNIVDAIKSELTSDVLGRLGSLIGESGEKTTAAAHAAVPSLLSLLASLASTGGGADKLINGLKQVDTTSQGGFGDILAGPQSEKVQEKGDSLLNILFGSGMLPIILGLLGKFVSMNPEAIKKLLSMLAPMILGTIAKQISGKPLTSDVLSSFFAEQKSNISAAMPPGLSLASVPGLRAKTGGAAPPEAGMPSWLLPLAGLCLLGALAWYFLGNQPAVEEKPAEPVTPAPVVKKEAAVPKIELSVPDASKLSTDLGGIYATLTKLLGDVKDAPSAETALPRISDMVPKLDGLKALWEKLPDAGKAIVAKVTTDNLAKLKEMVAKVLAIAGVSEKFKTTVEGLIATLGAFVTK